MDRIVTYYKKYLKDFLVDNGMMAENSKNNFRCIDPSHDDQNPSAHLYEDNQIVKCFGCGKSFDIFDAIGFRYKLSTFQEQLEKAKEIYGPVPDNYEVEAFRGKKSDNCKEVKYIKVDQTDFFKDSNRTLNEPCDECMRYLNSRGISLETANKFNLGHYMSEEYPPNRLLIPTSRYTYNVRSIDDDSKQKYKRPSGMPVVLFNECALVQKRYPVFVTEGELDAISIEELGYPAVGLGSASNTRLILERTDLDILEYPLIIALDNDSAGRKSSKLIQEKLNTLGIPCVCSDSLYAEFKDANECLVKDKNNFKKRLEASIMLSLQHKEYLDKEKKLRLLEYKKQSVKEKKEVYIKNRMLQLEPISTGYSKLDYVLNGGLQRGRLYTIGAISSLGKTTYFNQMAEYISSQGTDVLYFTLEMSEEELDSKGISRHTYKVCASNIDVLSFENAKTSDEVDRFWRNQSSFNENERKVITYATNDYFENGEHLYIHDDIVSLKNIRDGIIHHIDVSGELPVVFIDYLQIIPPEDKGLTDKANMDAIILGLKDMSRKFNIPIVVISSFNRQNYAQEANMTAFKESGTIEYSSDVVIALQFSAISNNDQTYNEVDERAKNVRKVDAVVLKNRNGISGARINYAFYTRYSYFYEL